MGARGCLNYHQCCLDRHFTCGWLGGSGPCSSHHEILLSKVLMLLLRRFILFINLLALIVEGILNINNMYVLLVCRAFQGIFVGCYMAITPIYINELAPKDIVGSFGVFTQLSIITGIIVSYALGLLLSKINAAPFVFYRVMVTSNSVTIIMQSILLLVDYIPESPCSLIRQNQNDRAKEVIAQFTVEKEVENVFR
jgi:MFS family permease